MGAYAEYLSLLQSSEEVTAERKRMLRRISDIRGGRDILVFAANLSRPSSPIGMDYTDILAFQDQLENMSGDRIDIVLETPGGLGEVAEDLAKIVRRRYKTVGMIIPGYAKSAGTIFAMAGDEILMGHASSLGPIDGQLQLANGRRFSADAFLEGFKKIKSETDKAGKLAPVHIPILHNISPGEIQNCENILSYSKRLVADWLAMHKFKSWTSHTDGSPVTAAERRKRAEDVAAALCSQSKWLTHNRSIKIADLEELRVKITNYDDDPRLHDAIARYYALLRMTFETSFAYKIFETPASQIYRFSTPARAQPAQAHWQAQKSRVSVSCIGCGTEFAVQVNWEAGIPQDGDAVPYSDPAACPSCKTQNPLGGMLRQLEGATGKKAVV